MYQVIGSCVDGAHTLEGDVMDLDRAKAIADRAQRTSDARGNVFGYTYHVFDVFGRELYRTKIGDAKAEYGSTL